MANLDLSASEDRTTPTSPPKPPSPSAAGEQIAVQQERPSGSASRSHGKSLQRPLGLALLAAALTCLFFILHYVVTHPVGTLDFANFYTAGTILREGLSHQLYNLSLQLKIERPLSPAGPFLPFYHPPFEALLFAPFAYLPFSLAFLIWDALNLAVLGIIFYLLLHAGPSLDDDSSLIWLATCFPLATGVMVLGQDSLLLPLVFLLAYIAMKRRREFAAGLALGLGLFRFEILLPFVFVFLLRRRWKVLAGVFASGAGALGASVAVVGWSGLYNYAKALIEVAQSSGKWSSGLEVVTMPSLRGALAAFFGGAIPHSWLFPVAISGSLLLLVSAAWKFGSIAEPERPAFDLQFSFAVIAALLASYHIFSHELTPLIVVAYLVLGYERVKQRDKKLLDRPGAMLLLVFALTMIVGVAVGFRNFSVLFVVLFGFLVWLWEEMPGLERAKLP
jgi:hypothetical protein